MCSLLLQIHFEPIFGLKSIEKGSPQVIQGDRKWTENVQGFNHQVH